MKFEPGDLLFRQSSGETRVVIAVQPYAGIPETEETETLLLYPDGSMRWYSSKWLAKIMRKVG